jgi:hypothetical protein
LKYCKVPYKLKLNAKGYAVWTNVKATDCPDNNTKLVDSIASSSKWDFSIACITRCILIRRTYSVQSIKKELSLSIATILA